MPGTTIHPIVFSQGRYMVAQPPPRVAAVHIIEPVLGVQQPGNEFCWTLLSFESKWRTTTSLHSVKIGCLDKIKSSITKQVKFLFATSR